MFHVYCSDMLGHSNHLYLPNKSLEIHSLFKFNSFYQLLTFNKTIKYYFHTEIMKKLLKLLETLFMKKIRLTNSILYRPVGPVCPGQQIFTRTVRSGYPWPIHFISILQNVRIKTKFCNMS